MDALFRSAAKAYRSRVIAVVLSGMLDDGAAGACAVKERGGVVIVQDPRTALYSSMPENALRAVQVDYCVPLADIAGLLVKLVQRGYYHASRTKSCSSLFVHHRSVARRLAKLNAKLVDLLELDHTQLATVHGVVEALQLLVGGGEFVGVASEFSFGLSALQSRRRLNGHDLQD